MADRVPSKDELILGTRNLIDKFGQNEERLAEKLTHEHDIDEIVEEGGERLSALRDGDDRVSRLLEQEEERSQYFSAEDELGKEYLSTGTQPSGNVIRRVVQEGDRSLLDSHLIDTSIPFPTSDAHEMSWWSVSGLWVGFWAFLALFIFTPVADALGVPYRGMLASLAVVVGTTLAVTVGREAYYRWQPNEAPAYDGDDDFNPRSRVKRTSIVNVVSFAVLALGAFSIGLEPFGSFIGSVIAVIVVAAIAMVVFGAVFGYFGGSVGAVIGGLLGLIVVLWWYSGNVGSFVAATPYVGNVAPGLPGSSVIDLAVVALSLAGLLGTVLYATIELPATFWRAASNRSDSPSPGVYSFLMLAPLFGFGWSLTLAEEATLQAGLVSEELFLYLLVAPAVVGTIYLLHHKLSASSSR